MQTNGVLSKILLKEQLKLEWDYASCEDLTPEALRMDCVFSTTWNSVPRARSGSSGDFVCSVQFYLISILGLLAWVHFKEKPKRLFYHLFLQQRLFFSMHCTVLGFSFYISLYERLGKSKYQIN